MMRAIPLWLRSHAQIGSSALTLYGTTIVTSTLGFAYWWFAAHEFSPSAVGAAAALISAMQLVATVCLLGLNTLLIAELARDASRAGPMLTTALTVVAVLSTAAGILVCIAGAAISGTYARLLGNGISAIIFTLTCAATAVTITLDDACIGVFRGQVQLRRNFVFATTKLALIPVMAFLLPDASGAGLVLSWLIGTVASAWFLRSLRRLGSQRYTFDFALIRRHAALAMRHHWLNVSLQMPRLAIPALAVLVVTSVADAAYFTAATIVAFIGIIPTHFSTVLFALQPGDTRRLHSEVRFTMLLSTVISAVTFPVLLIASSTILHLFSPSYGSAREAMVLLALTTLPGAVKAHYVAILRVLGHLQRAALTTAVGALLEVASSIGLGSVMGVTGLALGLLAAQLVEGVLFFPTVLSACRRPRLDDTTVAVPCSGALDFGPFPAHNKRMPALTPEGDA